MNDEIALEHSIFFLSVKCIKRVGILMLILLSLFLIPILTIFLIKFGFSKTIYLMWQKHWLIFLSVQFVIFIVLSSLFSFKANVRYKKVKSLINDQDYKPVTVTVKKPKFVWRLLAKSGGAAPRLAVDGLGKQFEVHFGDRLDEEFEANLYQVSSNWWIPSMEKNIVIPK